MEAGGRQAGSAARHCQHPRCHGAPSWSPWLHPASSPPLCFWEPSPMALPTPSGILITSQTLSKPLAPVATHHGTALASIPRQMGASDLLLWRIEKTTSWAMPGGQWPAHRGRCFPLPGTGDASMARLRLPSSRAIWRSWDGLTEVRGV